ncbi:MAG: GDSL-type esterase/lipase family protein [Bacteroidota bacterium]
MKNRLLFRISIVVNVIFLGLLMVIFYRYSEVFYQKKIQWNHSASIVMFGDSHTAGGKWNSLLETGPVLRMGWGGFSSDQLKNMIPDCISYKPEYVFILCGGNDIVGGNCYSIKRIIDNYRFMADTLRSNNIKPVFQKLLYLHDGKEYNTVVDSINSMLTEFCIREKIDLIDIGTSMNDASGLRADLTIDNCHLNSDGYELWSDAVNSYLKRKKP